MLNLKYFGIGLGDNPDFSDPRIIAAQSRIDEACEIGLAAVAAGMECLDLREWRTTPGGEFLDGKIVPVKTPEQVAADLLRWFRPEVAFSRARKVLNLSPPKAN